jgi:glycosyltransferase involved in cell wall biosynthesis
MQEKPVKVAPFSTARLRVERRPRGRRPHAIYLAIGFPPAAKSSAYRLRETANQFCAQGWDVTVVTITDASWEREYGLDHTLSDDVDPRVHVVKLPLAREDLETDIRAFSEERSLDPQGWVAKLRKRDQESFPEANFGGWRRTLEDAVVRIHQRRPADLLMTTCAPYVNIAATWKLWTKYQVPYVIDFRDGWSLDVITGKEAFQRDSVAGRWESQVLAEARQIWTVNDPIADFYRARYPQLADRVRVVRNGYDEASLPDQPAPAERAEGLTFGYLGSLNFPPAVLDTVLTAWRMARKEDDLIAKSRFEVRGHIGAGALREFNAYTELLKAAEPDGVTFGGPVAKADVAAAYGRWDALVLMLVGGRYVTSGKVYEYLASGLPIVSAHEVDHDAVAVLQGNPLWTGAVGLNPHRLAESLIRAGRLAIETTEADRLHAREQARRFTRAAQLEVAVSGVIGDGATGVASQKFVAALEGARP